MPGVEVRAGGRNARLGIGRAHEVDWRSALAIAPRLTRPRPYAYLMPASKTLAAKRLADLGVTVLRLA